ncbi:MAG: Asp-tRNA(Asn)/Glu-tRNA(Gln) amidotransferase subunit GatB [Candidatus Woesebacteria bacterium]
MSYTPVVGIEIHVELKTKSKMFCGCVNDPFGAQKPNIYTCPVCLGMPGGLPVANKTAIEWTIKVGQALGCEIALFSKFDRKHYFYPDLPKGYQISQYDQPLCVNGLVKTEFGDVRITRVHLEEDTGKLIHQDLNGQKVSLVDFNRSGVPLVEIVTEPDIKSPEMAKAYAKKIRQIIKYLDVSLADMEKGSMRLEANISVQTEEEKQSEQLPAYKVEVKNLNSFRYIERAIAYEVKRQGDVRDGNTLPTQETRGWNESKNQTFAQRSKESAEDYRYFPDPDIPPLLFTQSYIDSIKDTLPLLPDQVIATWVAKGMKESEAQILSEDRANVLLVDELFQKSSDALKIVTQLVNKKIMLSSNVDDIIAQSKVLTQTNSVDERELEKVIDEVLTENAKAVNDYKAGKTQVIGFLLGMVKRKLGNIDTVVLKEALIKKLS